MCWQKHLSRDENDRNGTIVCKKEEGVNRDYSIHHTADLALLISSFVGKKLLSPDPRLQLCFSIIVDNTQINLVSKFQFTNKTKKYITIGKD